MLRSHIWESHAYVKAQFIAAQEATDDHDR
jgi:hypothetical protein